MAELLGKVTGCSRGKGGSMHFFDVEKGFLGGHAIVGSHIPLAAGCRFRDQVSRRGSRLCLLLRRRRHQPGGRARGPQHGCPVEAAGHLHRREQPLCHGNVAGTLDGGARLAAPRGDGLRDSRRHDQRQRHRADGQDHARSGQPGPGRRGTELHRGPDLPLQGALDQRSWKVPSPRTSSTVP